MPPPFRADHLGPLIPPTSLQEARQHAATNPSPSSPQHLQQCQRDAIRDIVQQQLDHHVRPITSGGFEHTEPSYDFLENLQGVTVIDTPLSDYQPNHPYTKHLKSHGQTSAPAVTCTGKIAHVTSPLLPQWLYLRSLVPESQWRECKMSVVSPTYFHSLLGREVYTKDSGYEDDKEFFADLVTAYRTEIMLLYEHGLRLLQIDDPRLATMFGDEEWVAGQESDSGRTPGEVLDQYIRVHNAILEGLPTDLTIGIHLCRGTGAGTGVPHSNDVYSPIAEKIFNSLNYQLYYLDFSTDSTIQSNGSPQTDHASPLQSLSHLPLGKSIVLGLIPSAPSTSIPTKDTIKQSVLDAASIIAQARGRSRNEVLRDSIGISPSCGFQTGSTEEEEEMWRKLGLVREVAMEIFTALSCLFAIQERR